MSTKRIKNYNNPNFWGMIQNVLIASLNKGQFIIGIVGIVLIILTIKLPSNDAKDLITQFIEVLKDWKFLGWFTSTLLSVGWFFSNKRLRRIYSEEFSRVGQEKTNLQNKFSKSKLKTSKNL